MAKKKKKQHYSGIGGQAVLEGVMMKNKDDYAIAVRKSNGEIDVDVEVYHSILHGAKIKNVPFIRGIFNFIDSLRLGMRAINHSAMFYEDETSEAKEDEKALDKSLDKVSNGRSDKILMALSTVFAVALAVGLFIVLPLLVTRWLSKYMNNESLLAIIEGGIRVIVFLIYIISISLMKDIRRLYQYHGAEHKCINCIERGRELTVGNVMRSSRIHKRCGTSFMFLVIIISVILFFFIRIDNVFLKVLIRLALVPVIAGISYEAIRLAGKTDNIFVKIISAPGMWLQHATTKEPDETMVEVAIKSVEAVFDWKKFLKEEFELEFEEVEAAETPATERVGVAEDNISNES